MASKREINSQYDLIAEDYVNNQRGFFTGKDDWTRSKLKQELKKYKGKKILDIGCGAGDDIKWCEENGIEAYGVEYSEKMLNLAKNNVAYPENVKIGDYESIPFDDNYFDLVMGRFSLHYLKNFELAYKEIGRVLKSGGQLLIVASNPTYDTLKLQETDGDGLISVNLYGGRVVVKFPPHTLTDYFSREFFRQFVLQEIIESESVDAENPLKIPETLYFKAVKL
ncbi:MAG: ubiquinone/menaquinone biosynthesis methyltransferase ubie [Parcubacteria group bacterium LiPW_30]|nr:MAG: ubiquinone/menaquinone biosynthesis methyltransferase ubie [Parcubacteria group bacterium LiPW_30]